MSAFSDITSEISSLSSALASTVQNQLLAFGYDAIISVNQDLINTSQINIDQARAALSIIRTSAVGAFTTTQVQSLSTTEVSSLSTTDVSSLSTTQINAFTLTEIASLSTT